MYAILFFLYIYFFNQVFSGGYHQCYFWFLFTHEGNAFSICNKVFIKLNPLSPNLVGRKTKQYLAIIVNCNIAHL